MGGLGAANHGCRVWLAAPWQVLTACIRDMGHWPAAVGQARGAGHQDRVRPGRRRPQDTAAPPWRGDRAHSAGAAGHSLRRAGARGPGQAADNLLALFRRAHHPERPHAPGAGRLHGAGRREAAGGGDVLPARDPVHSHQPV